MTINPPAAELPNPFMPGNAKPGTYVGDYVAVPAFGYTGRVYNAHYGCPEDDDWRAMQTPQAQDEALKTKRWVSVLVHHGGAVVFPETMVEPIEPFVLKNNHGLLLWGDVERE